jgi:hypothetical protein
MPTAHRTALSSGLEDCAPHSVNWSDAGYSFNGTISISRGPSPIARVV